jgi:hypothetical protein
MQRDGRAAGAMYSAEKQDQQPLHIARGDLWRLILSLQSLTFPPPPVRKSKISLRVSCTPPRCFAPTYVLRHRLSPSPIAKYSPLLPAAKEAGRNKCVDQCVAWGKCRVSVSFPSCGRANGALAPSGFALARPSRHTDHLSSRVIDNVIEKCD